MTILTYLRLGKIRVAGYNSGKFNSKLIGNFYPLQQRSGSSISELIICCDNLKICNSDPKVDNSMYKMIPARNTDPNFPLFPNKVNPSNSVAIGGIFGITTQNILKHISNVMQEIKETSDADEEALKKALVAAVPYEGEKMSLDEIQKMYAAPPTQAPVYASSFAPAPASSFAPAPLTSEDAAYNNYTTNYATYTNSISEYNAKVTEFENLLGKGDTSMQVGGDSDGDSSINHTLNSMSGGDNQLLIQNFEQIKKQLSVELGKLDTIESLAMGKPEFVAIVKKIGHSLVRGPMDMFLKR
jgi:hypothetical protein